jgi:hypothetical protein
MNKRSQSGYILIPLFVIGGLLAWAVSCSDDPCSPVEKYYPVTPIYHADFSQALGSEWSIDVRETSPTGVQFLGRFGNQMAKAQLSLKDLPSHTSLTLTFKLYIIHSWDGNSENDMWRCKVVNGPTLVYASFCNTGGTQSYPLDSEICGGGGCYNCAAKAGAAAVDSLDFSGTYSTRGDAIYEIAVTFAHNASSIVIEFQGLNSTSGIDDESWGIDDVYLWKGPSTFPTR